MMALDATGRDSGTLATPAQGPVVDARSSQPVPAPEVAAAGASPQGGPRPTRPPRPARRTPSRFRSAISEYKPVYFDIGTRGKTTARFQISAKYRLFSPAANRPANWYENFYLGYTDLALGSAERLDALHRHHLQSQRLLAVRQSLVLGKPELAPGVNVGAEHNSNGKDGPDSRSVNDGYVEPRFHYRLDGGSTLTFAPRIKAYFGVAGENGLRRLRRPRRLAAALGPGQRRRGHGPVPAGRSAAPHDQLDFAWPLQLRG